MVKINDDGNCGRGIHCTNDIHEVHYCISSGCDLIDPENNLL